MQQTHGKAQHVLWWGTLFVLMTVLTPTLSIAAPLSQVGLTTNVASPQPVNGTITLVATAVGGTAVQYRFRARTLVGTSTIWQELAPYSGTNTCNWQPTNAGVYYLEVWVKENGSAMTYEVSNSRRFDIIATAISITLDATPPSPQPVGSSITLRANGSGFTSPEFQFWLGTPQNGASAWTPLNAYSTSPTLVWKPTQAVTYQLKVSMRAAGQPASAIDSNEVTYMVRSLLGNEIGSTLGITKFLDNKAAAVSFTFDDGLQSQLDVAVPLLDTFGFKATFGIIAGATPNIDGEAPAYPFVGGSTGSWSSWVRIAGNGHEIANHTMTHQDLTTFFDPVILDREINVSALQIATKVGTAPLTFVFPYNHYTDYLADLALQHHIAIRSSNVIGYGNRLYTAGEMNAAVDNAIQHGEWMVPMLHGFAQGEYAFVDRWTFQAHLSYLAGQSAQVWVETYGGVSRYQQERDSAQMRISELDAHRLTFTLSTPMDPAIFNRPLTVLVATGGIAATTAQATVVETGQSLPTRVTPQGILVNVTPGSNRVRVQWQ